jgi:hypothetical protein
MATVNSPGYASDVVVASALPQEMDYRLPASLPAAKNFEIRVQPVNSQTFEAGNTIQIDIPCGRPGQYLDPTTTYIRFRATYTHAGAVTTDQSRFLGTPNSYFIKQEVYGNNSVLLESISELGVLTNTLVNLQLNDGDKRGLSTAMGFDFDTTAYGSSSNLGHSINASTQAAGVFDGLNFEYSMPVLGLLGSGTSKCIPIGEVYGLRVEWQMDSFTNFTRVTSATPENGVTSCRITDFEFVANIIELSPEANALVIAQNPDKIRIRSQSYRQASNQLNASSTAGTQDLLVGIRLSSLKSIYMCCSPTNAAEKKFAGVNPNLDQGTCYIIGGQNYPKSFGKVASKAQLVY